MTACAGRPPVVSVILPVYNGGRFLQPALESIRAQTFTDFECLVLDDGSTDGSGDVAQRFADGDARFRVIRRENRGLVATLNELLGHARGDLFARMDADDVALPDRLARQVEFMTLHPEVVCLGGGQILMDECDRPIAPIEPPVDDLVIQESALRGHGSICHPTAVIRAAALRELGGYRPDFYPAEDLDLWLRLGELGALANLATPVIFYRIHSGSISGLAAGGRQREAGRRACAAAWLRRGRSDVVYEAGAAWRPGSDADSRYRFALDYGWRAHLAGFRATSRTYGLKAIRLKPWRQGGWRLLAKAMAAPKAGRDLA